MDRKFARIKSVDLAVPIVAMANADGGYLAIGSDRYIRQHVIQPLVEQGKLIRTIPEKPSSPNQKYVKK